MKRKIVLSISALLIVFDIGFTVAMFNAGERQLTAAFETAADAVALVRDYVRPLPRLSGLR